MDTKVKNFVEKYYVERKNTSSYKWDILEKRFGNADLTGMWVADMEFKVPESIEKAMIERIHHGVFGYSFVPNEYYDAFFKWQKRRYNTELKKEWMRFSPGVVSAFYWAVGAFSKIGESVMIITPVYYPFRNSILDNKRNLVRSEAVLSKGKYVLDFEDIEKKIIENDVKLFIHCSPHNPIGRVWTQEESEKLFDLLYKHNVMIVSDEIHQDLIIGDRKFISALNLKDGKYNDKLIVMTSASKTFNLACLLHSAIIIPNENVRKIYDNFTKTVNQTEISLLGAIAATAGYEGGEEWLDGLIATVRHNYNYLKNEFAQHSLDIFMPDLEGTYLTWLDLSKYVDKEKVKEFIQDKCGLAIDYGEWFSDMSKGWIRINLATNPKFVALAAKNIISSIKESK